MSRRPCCVAMIGGLSPEERAQVGREILGDAVVAHQQAQPASASSTLDLRAVVDV